MSLSQSDTCQYAQIEVMPSTFTNESVCQSNGAKEIPQEILFLNVLPAISAIASHLLLLSKYWYWSAIAPETNIAPSGIQYCAKMSQHTSPQYQTTIQLSFNLIYQVLFVILLFQVLSYNTHSVFVPTEIDCNTQSPSGLCSCDFVFLYFNHHIGKNLLCAHGAKSISVLPLIAGVIFNNCPAEIGV